MKAYYLENKERIKQKALEYYYANRQERLSYSKEYYLENKEKIQEYRALIHPKIPTPPKQPKEPKPPRIRKVKPPAPVRVKIFPLTQEPKFNFIEASHIISFS